VNLERRRKAKERFQNENDLHRKTRGKIQLATKGLLVDRVLFRRQLAWSKKRGLPEPREKKKAYLVWKKGGAGGQEDTELTSKGKS